MFNQSTFLLQTMSDKGLSRVDEQAQARKQASKQFWSVYMRGQVARFWSWLTGQCNQLKSLSEHKNNNGRYAGLQTVALTQIVGSEEHTGDFDSRFRPLHYSDQDRWAGSRPQCNPDGDAPYNWSRSVLLQPFVRDGHHRLSVAYALGQAEVDAQVTVWE